MAEHQAAGASAAFERFDDAGAAVRRICALYDAGAAALRQRFDALSTGAEAAADAAAARYPMVSLAVDTAALNVDARHSYGVALEPGRYETTIARPSLFAPYLEEQLGLIMARHGCSVSVGLSDRPMPLPYVLENSLVGVDEAQLRALQHSFALPDLMATDDAIANGVCPSGAAARGPEAPRPLALFTAERTDYSLARLAHYTGTGPEHFQRFILLTNYQRYVDAFIEHGLQAIGSGGFERFVEPGDVTWSPSQPDQPIAGERPQHLPQMPAYHLTRADGDGVTLVNIGVGPSNAKTITDHLAVLRPHCWLMLGHCAGLRRSQLLGDYVLAHGYMREDHVLDQDVPLWAPVPPIAEVQVALQEAVARITGLAGAEMKTRMRTGTVATTDNRNWELRASELHHRLNQSRAIAVDMESATIAANGFRFRVPYGTLLCVSDKPLHGELKLRGVANAFYRERVGQHMQIGLETFRLLRDAGVDRLHSRKLRGFDEPPFR